jgi:proteasome activator subunit 4
MKKRCPSSLLIVDWVAALFRRILALLENLPEEGGKRFNTAGKQEEAVLSSIKTMTSTVCVHLSDPLFDLALRIVHDYATSNAKANTVKAIGQLVGALARGKPELTISKFIPFSISQIKEELKHGASSIRTTSAHAAVSSDTTLHWSKSMFSALCGCSLFLERSVNFARLPWIWGQTCIFLSLIYAARALTRNFMKLLKYQDDLTHILSLLVEHTKSERGYSATGKLLSSVLHTVSAVYPTMNRFVNDDEWNSEGNFLYLVRRW